MQHGKNAVSGLSLAKELGDMAKLAQEAHKLKGSSSIIAARYLPNLASQLQQAARENGEGVPYLVGQIRQQFGLLERDIAVRLKLRETNPQGDSDVDKIMGGNLRLLVRHARAFGLHRLVSSLSTHGVEVGEVGEEGGGKGGGETMSSMRLSVLASLKAACADEGLEACADEGIASLGEWFSTIELALRVEYRDVLCRHRFVPP